LQLAKEKQSLNCISPHDKENKSSRMASIIKHSAETTKAKIITTMREAKIP